MFYLTGIVVTCFLTTILVSKRGKTDADFILTGWLVAIGLHLTSYYLKVSGDYLSVPGILGFELPLPLIHGPFLFLYTQSLTSQVVSRRHGFLHFIPFLLAYAMIGSFLMSPAEHKIFVYENKGLGYEKSKALMNLAIMLSGIIYVALSLRLLANHRRNLRDQFSYAEKINLAWLRYLIYGIAVIWGIIIFFGGDATIYGAVVVFVFVLGYFGIKQVGIFTQQARLENASLRKHQEGDDHAAAGESGKAKYLKSGLNEADAAVIHAGLTQAMLDKRLYANPELTLAELAEHLHVHPNNLSQVINTLERKSFYDYINSLRVEEFKRLAFLPGSQKFNLLGLAQNCGFNSKTSFNRNFKNSTGLSPSEFLSQAQIQLRQ